MAYRMLTDNYRSHVRLLDLPSRLFYGGALKACAPAAAVAAPAWQELVIEGREIPDEDDQAQEASNPGDGRINHHWKHQDAAAVPAHTAEGEMDEADVDPGIVVQQQKEDDLLENPLAPSSILFVGVNGKQMQDGEAPR
jgi:hypothetical protein